MGKLIVFRESNPEPVLNPPFFAEVVEGAPTTWAWRHAIAEDGLVTAGIWKSTPGAFRMDYKVWEFCHIFEGSCTIVPDGGRSMKLNAGDSFVCEPGLTGIWRIDETMRKYFVVRRS